MWLVQPKFAVFNSEHKSALRVDGQFFGSSQIERDGTRIGARSNNEVMFQLLLVAVVEQIHAGVHFAIAQLGVRGNVCVPLPRIVAYDIVGLARQLVERLNPWRCVSTNQFHSHNGWWDGWFGLRRDARRYQRPWLQWIALGRGLAQHEHGFGTARQKQRVAATPGQKLDLGIDLAPVGFKAEGQHTVGFRIRRVLRSY